MSTNAKAEIVNQPVVRLTIELSTKHAAELAGLLSRMSFADFSWAGSIYDALQREGVRDENVFTDWAHGPDIFIVRKQG